MRVGIAAIGAIAGLVGALRGADAATSCSVDALTALQVPDVGVAEAKPVAAIGSTPAHCDVQGTVVTKGAGVADGLARFAMQLPDQWQHRFLFLGVGGNAGNLVPSANAVDRASALGKGYVTILTDTGHIGDGTSAKWTLTPDGQPDVPKRTDFFHRAAHDVTVAGKALSAAFYGGSVEHAYFDGCSTGGRMAMMEAERYPTDYDGVIAGDPMMSFHTYTARAVVQQATLAARAAYIPPELVQALDARVIARCDALDGAKDGLVQSSCPIRANEVVCKPGDTAACLSKDQAHALASYTSPFRDKRGRVVFGPWPMTHMADPQGLPYTVTGRGVPDLSDLAAPWKEQPEMAPRAWSLVQEMITYWLAMGPEASVADLDVDGRTNTIGDKMLAMMDKTFAEGNVRDPSKLGAFLAQDRKMILYHGTSDPSIPPSQTVAFYQELSKRRGSARTQDNVRLFLVPGMHHCSGGPAPDQFDTLSALERWVEHGQPPALIAASTKPDIPAPHHLPLCPYPQQARYSGNGSMRDLANWHCK